MIYYRERPQDTAIPVQLSFDKQMSAHLWIGDNLEVPKGSWVLTDSKEEQHTLLHNGYKVFYRAELSAEYLASVPNAAVQQVGQTPISKRTASANDVFDGYNYDPEPQFIGVRNEPLNFGHAKPGDVCGAGGHQTPAEQVAEIYGDSASLVDA